MANRTDPLAKQVHGLNPQGLMSRIIRRKVYGCNFWKEHCFAVSAESVIEPCVGLSYVGGTYGGKRQPAPFLCVVLKLLQLQPEEEVILEFIKQERFKYLRAVGAFYFRLVGQAREVYVHLEPLLADYRKLRLRLADGKFKIVCMDEFIDDMLKKTAMLDVDLPVLPKRETLEEEGLLPPTRLSALEHDVEVYAGNAAAAAAGGGAGDGGKRVVVFASEREQQLWLLQKQQLQQQQKTLQRHVQQQRMRLLQQQQEQQLLEQVRELELENDYNDATQATTEGKNKNEAAATGGKMQRPKIEEEGEGWWREGTRPHHRYRQQAPAGGGDAATSGTTGSHASSRHYYHGGSRVTTEGRAAKVSSRSPTPIMHRTAAEAAEGAAVSSYRSSQRGTRHHDAVGGDKSYRQHGDYQRNAVAEDEGEYEERSAAAAAGREGAADGHRYRSGRGIRRTGGDRRRAKEEAQEQREDQEDEEEEERGGNREYRERGSGRYGAVKEEREERGQRQRQQDRRRSRWRRGQEGESATEEEEAEGDHGDVKRKRRRSHGSDYDAAETNGVAKEELIDRREDKGYRSHKTKQRRSSTSRHRDGGEEAAAAMSQDDGEAQQRERDRRQPQKERQQQQHEQQEDEEERRREGGGEEETEGAKDKRSDRRYGRCLRGEEARGGGERPRRGEEEKEDEGEKQKGTGQDERETADTEKRRKRPETQTHPNETGDRTFRDRTFGKEGDAEGRRHRRNEGATAEASEERRRTTHGYNKYEAEGEKMEASRHTDEKSRVLSRLAERGSSDKLADGENRDTRRRRGGVEKEDDEERGGRRRAGEEGCRRRDSVSSSEAEKARRRRSFCRSEERETRRHQERRDQGKEAEKRSNRKNDDREEAVKDNRRSDKRRRHSVSPSPPHRTKDAGRNVRRTAAEGNADDKKTAEHQQPAKKMFEHPFSSSSKKGGAGGGGKGKDKELSVQEWDALRAELGLKPLK